MFTLLKYSSAFAMQYAMSVFSNFSHSKGMEPFMQFFEGSKQTTVTRQSKKTIVNFILKKFDRFDCCKCEKKWNTTKLWFKLCVPRNVCNLNFKSDKSN